MTTNPALTNQSAFNNVLRSVVELSEDNQKKIQESLEKTGRHFAPTLEEAARVCRERGISLPERIVPVVTHGSVAFKNDAESICQKYENVVLTATKLYSAINSSQAEARIITRALDGLPESQARALREPMRKVIDDGDRKKELILKHIREVMPIDISGGLRGRAVPKSPNYARPGGGPVLPEGGLAIQRTLSPRSMLGVGEKRNADDKNPKKF